MPVDTRTLPGTLTRGQDGEQVARGWCLITYEMVGNALPLEEWRGEIALGPEDYATVSGVDGELYLHLRPYGGVFEPWHGPVRLEPVGSELDPAGRRMRLQPAGALIRSRYTPDELKHGWPDEPKPADDQIEESQDVPPQG